MEQTFSIPVATTECLNPTSQTLMLFWSLWYFIYKTTGLKPVSYFSLCLYKLHKITQQIEARIRFMDVIPRARAVNNAMFFTGCYEIAACTHLEDCGLFYDALPSNRQSSSKDQELGSLLRQQYSSYGYFILAVFDWICCQSVYVRINKS